MNLVSRNNSSERNSNWEINDTGERIAMKIRLREKVWWFKIDRDAKKVREALLWVSSIHTTRPSRSDG
jgi:hypothetical protein